MRINKVNLTLVSVSDSLEVRGKGKANPRDNKAAKNRKRKERRKIKDKKRAVESRKQYIKNLSNEQLTDKQITLLSHGLKFIPTPVTKENLIRRQLLADFNQFARRMRLQYIFHGEENEPHPVPGEVGLGTTSSAICSSGDLLRGDKIRARKY